MLKSYPHQLSGGMAQRVCIALALTGEPKLLVADEPTTALDVTVQAEILCLLRALVRDTGLSVVIVSHDLGVVADICDDVAVMYAGEVVESGSAAAVLDDAAHPYTMALLGANPHVPDGEPVPLRLASIAGTVPPPGSWPTGCRFASRCQFAQEQCTAPFAAAARARRRLGALHPGRRAGPRARHLGRRRRRRRDRVGADPLSPPTSPPRPLECPHDRRPPRDRRRARRRPGARAGGARPRRPLRLRAQGAAAPRRPSTASASTSPRARPSALVGESGSGKSTIGKAVLGLQPPTVGHRAAARAGHHRDVAQAAQPAGGRPAGGLPGPVLLAQPGPDDRPDAGRAARG